jgi:two-component system, LuxR family, sensor kinase FixL
MSGDSVPTVSRPHPDPPAASSDPQVFRLLVEGIQDYAIYMLDPEGRVTSWNPGAEAFKGYRSEEIIGKHFSVFFLPEDVKAGKPQRALEIAAAAGRYEEDGLRVRKDGTRVWAHAVITALRDEGGRLRGFAKVTRDITKSKRAEERFEALVEAAPDAMVIADQSGKITLVNAQAEKLFGYQRSELLGADLEMLIPETLRAKHIAHRSGYAREPRVREMGANLDLVARRKNGTEFSVEISLSPIRTEDGLWVASSIRDVTARRRMERLSTFGHLVGSIGHELRNPLGVIESSLFILRGRIGNDERTQKHVERIGQQLSIANEIVSNLLDMIRDRPLVRAKTRLADVVAQARSLVQWPCEVRFVQEGIEDLPPISGDAGQLRQALRNLFENAVHATEGKGEIRIRGTHQGRQVELSVEDTGPGVSPAVLSHLFEPLVTSKAKGIGLGLALVKRIVESHGGSIVYQPASTGGARFIVRLPAENSSLR